MHMTFRARVIDITPVLLVFALVAAFATLVFMEYVVYQPLDVPANHAAETAPGQPPASTPAR